MTDLKYCNYKQFKKKYDSFILKSQDFVNCAIFCVKFEIFDLIFAFLRLSQKICKITQNSVIFSDITL